jgi:hypothetical protein
VTRFAIKDWLPGQPLGGKYFVQRVATDSRGRTDKEIARAWVERLAAAIRSVDVRHLIAVGVIDSAQVFPAPTPRDQLVGLISGTWDEPGTSHSPGVA